MTKLPIEFTFAGFNFPRYIPEIKRSKHDRRTFRAVYYHAPRPITGGTHTGYSFYLQDAGGFDRYKWADEVVNLRHTGWFCDEFQDDKIRGLVVRLPHGRFLAGWSMGEQMASAVEGEIYTSESEAAYAADSIAERVAESEREYQEEERARLDAEEARLLNCQGGDAEELDGY